MKTALIAVAGLAFAQQAEAAAQADLAEVIVTARRIAEDAHRVPLAISVVGKESLGAGGILDLPGLAAATPGLGFESMWGGINAAPVIRGQSQPSTAGDNVGVFVDEIYQAGRSQIDLEMLDLERIEVVRGPQNTLFGRSTFAGAIHYVSRAPTSERTGYLRGEAGSDGLAGLQAAWSGRLAEGPWLGRVAFGHRQARGTLDSTQGESLGDFRRDAAALTFVRRSADDSRDAITLGMRFNRGVFGHPASSTLNAVDYNCGARDATSGLWTYFCGRAPLSDQFTLSPQMPDSHGHSEQVALRIEQPFGDLTLHSLTGYYHARSTAYRDFDGSDSGILSGVCTVGLSCGPAAPSSVVTRFLAPNVVSRPEQETTDWSQEFRLSQETADDISWMIGLAASWTRELGGGALGVDRGDLLPTERLTALLASTPGRVGPISLLNAALVTDSREEQVLQNQTLDERGSIALFGSVDWQLSPIASARLELRAAHETQRTDSQVANFAPNPEPDPPAIGFTELTPRLAFALTPTANLFAWGSIARGARAGGINTTPGLTEDERQYDPEYNWTTELGLRHRSGSFIEAWEATVYRIDWDGTQILGVATSPGVNNLIIRNTAGLKTHGVEAQLQVRIGDLMRARVAFSHADPRFNEGSDDAGSRPFCGLTKQPPSSDFCAYGPPRTDSNGSVALVPYLDDNVAARTPRTSWALSLQSLPRTIAGEWQFRAEATFTYQDNVFERPINGVSYGARELLGARLILQRRDWQVELWGNNLTGDDYLRAAASRGGAFYPSLPRPLDFLYGEGRRLGITVSLDFGAN